MVRLLVLRTDRFYPQEISYRQRQDGKRRSQNIKSDNSFVERVEEFKYLGTALTNQNSIQEEINADLSQGIFAIIPCRIFCFQFAVQRFKD